MLLKGLFCVYIQASLLQFVFTQCIGPYIYPREPSCPANVPFVEDYGFGPVAPLYGRVIGGNLVVDTSAPYSPTGPAGISIFSDDLLIEGPVLVSGNLPFLGTIALEGILPATGSSSVSYACGNGNIGIEGTPTFTEAVLPMGGIVLPEGLAGFNTGLGRL